MLPYHSLSKKKGIWNACFFPRCNSNMSTAQYIEHGITLWALSDLGNTPCLFILMLRGMSYINQPIKVTHPQATWHVPNLPRRKLHICIDFLYRHLLSEMWNECVYILERRRWRRASEWAHVHAAVCSKSTELLCINVTNRNSALSSSFGSYTVSDRKVMGS